MPEPVETSELLAFTKAVEAKSLSRAATELGIPRATIGRRLARLEERLEVRLLRRTTRSLALTDAGEAFYQHARVALDAVAQAEASVRRLDAGVRGSLRVSLPPGADDMMRAMVCEFALRYPEVRMHLHFSSRHVDLQRDGYDVVVRAGTALEPGVIARMLARAPMIAVASPLYLRVNGTPRTAKDLGKHRCLVGFARGEVPQTHWPLLDGGKIAIEGAMMSNEILLLRDAAIAGLGITLLPTMILAQALAEKTLVKVLAKEIGIESSIAVLYPEREFVPPQVRAFVDHVVAWAKARFGPPRSISPRGGRTTSS